MPNESNRRMQIHATVPLALTAATMAVIIIPWANQQQSMKWWTMVAALFLVGWIVPVLYYQ